MVVCNHITFSIIIIIIIIIYSEQQIPSWEATHTHKSPPIYVLLVLGVWKVWIYALIN
jgi:hypothetical protein